MAAPALSLDLSGIAVDQLEIPDPIANAFVAVQATMNNLGNVHIAADAAIDIAKTTLGTFVEVSDWTPTWTNLSVGNGTVVAKKTRIGKAVFWFLRLTFGSTTSVTGDVSFSAPIAMGAIYTGANPLGQVRLIDSSPGSTYEGEAVFASATTIYPTVLKSDQPNTYVAIMAPTQPFTWATNDALLAWGMYFVD